MGVVTETGNFITDLMRQSAVGWLSTQVGGNAVDGFGKRKVSNMVQRSYFDGTIRANTLGWNTGADIGNGASTTLTQVTDASFPIDAGNIAQVAFHRPAGSNWSYVAAAIVQPAGGPFVPGLKYTASFYASVVAGTAQQMDFHVADTNSTNIVTNGVVITPNGSVQRFTFTFTALISGNLPNFFLAVNAPGAGDVTLHISGLQVEPGSVANTYIPTQGTTVISQAQGTDDGSTTSWEGYTNLFRRGQCDSVIDCSQTGGGVVTFAIDTANPAPFSDRSFRVTADGTAVNQGGQMLSGTGLAAAATVNGLVGAWFRGPAGASYAVRARWSNTDASIVEGVETIFNATGDWQWITPVMLAVSAGKVGDSLRVLIHINGTRAESFLMAHGTLCVSAAGGKQICPPYLPTSGGATATVGNGGITIPSSLVSDVQGWVAMRVRIGWSPAQYTGGLLFPQAWVWQTDTNNRLNILWNSSNNTWAFDKRVGGVPSDAGTGAQAFNAGDYITIIGYWTATEVALSINGAAFIHKAIATALSPSGGSMTIMSNPFDSQVMWFACGKGTLTDADAATLNALGNSDPALGLLGAAAQQMMVWDAKTAVDNSYIDAPTTNDINGSATVAAPGVVYVLGGGVENGSGACAGAGTLLAKGGGAETGTATLAGAGTVYDGGGFPFFADTIFTGSGTDYIKGSGSCSGTATWTGDGEILRSPPAFSTGRIGVARTGDIDFVRSEN